MFQIRDIWKGTTTLKFGHENDTLTELELKGFEFDGLLCSSACWIGYLRCFRHRFLNCSFKVPDAVPETDIDIRAVIAVGNAESVEFRVRLGYGRRENLTIEALLALFVRQIFPILLELFRLVLIYLPVNQNYHHNASFKRKSCLKVDFCAPSPVKCAWWD